jgi:RNA 3'-terminal phosphate cyclase (ATP)
MSNSEVVFVDGSFGEGGGQILRTSLALSCITGKALHIEHIRAKRRNPGLAKQHIRSIYAACEISCGKCAGAEEGSQTIDFRPGSVRGGQFNFEIGSAGSASLVAQTILPALFLADKPSTISITGGTHNPLAPPFDFLAESFFPAIATAGFYGKCRLLKYGFYPRGGGSITFDVQPRQKGLSGQINFCQPFTNLRISARIYTARLGRRVAEKQRQLLLNSQLGRPVQFKQLKGTLLAEDIELVDITDSNSHGNCVVVRLFDDTRTVIFSAFGMRGKPSEKVIAEVVEPVIHFMDGSAAIDSFLADQLLTFMAITNGGSFTTDVLSEHLNTNIHTIQKFLPVSFSVSNINKVWKIETVD